MVRHGLRFDEVPPLSVPFRFFLTAPVYLLLIALLLLWRGPEALASRGSPAALAATHLFTLGFMSMVMIGAMLQMLPVVAGAPVRRPRLVAGTVWIALNIGATALAAGFLSGADGCFSVACIALGIAFAVFIAGAAAALRQVPEKTPTVRTMRLALLALAVTAALGLTLAARSGMRLALPGALRELHPAWGLLGWLGLLTIGVAYQVVPMFQITPAYPAWIRKPLAAAIFLFLAAWSVASLHANAEPLARACRVALALAYLLFAGATIALQLRSRRRAPDVTLDFWRIGMGSLAAAAALWLAGPVANTAERDSLIGVLALLGFAGCVINGMLYKIMPFIVWFHLQARTRGGRHLPNMKTVLGERRQRWQLRAGAAAIALLAAPAAWPAVPIYPGALTLAASTLLLWANMFAMLRTFRRTLAIHEAGGGADHGTSLA